MALQIFHCTSSVFCLQNDSFSVDWQNPQKGRLDPESNSKMICVFSLENPPSFLVVKSLLN